MGAWLGLAARFKTAGPGALLGLAALALLLLCPPPATRADMPVETLRYDSVPGRSLVRVFGSSTMHDWSAQGTIINGSLVIVSDLLDTLDSADKGFPIVRAKHVALDFRIPVTSLDGDCEGLDDEMYKNLGCREHPDITFHFVGAAFVAQPSRTRYEFNARGVLDINGVKKPHDLLVTVTHLPKGRLSISTETSTRMTDFNITPPSFLGGILESGDKVRVKVRWSLKQTWGPGELLGG